MDRVSSLRVGAVGDGRHPAAAPENIAVVDKRLDSGGQGISHEVAAHELKRLDEKIVGLHLESVAGDSKLTRNPCPTLFEVSFYRTVVIRDQ